MSISSSIHDGSPDRGINPTAIFTAYLSVVCLTSAIKAPFGAFEGIPFFVVVTPIIWLLQGRRAMIATGLIFSLLAIYEFFKNLQLSYVETWKAIFGIAALSMLLPTIYFSLLPALRSNPKVIGMWLCLTLCLELTAVVVDQCLGGLGIIHSTYRNYFLPIHAYSGFFDEPSHVGMFMSPFIFMAIFDYRLYRRYMGKTGVFALIGLGFLCPSTTEVAAIALAITGSLAKRISKGHLLYLIVATVCVVAASAGVLSIPSIQSRILGVLMPKNPLVLMSQSAISVLVFFKGMQMARYALGHVPLGEAFLNMTALNSHASISHLSTVLYRLNSSDGSSILFKGICEFGYAFLVFAAYGAIKTVIHLFRYDFHQCRFNDLLVLAFEFSIFTFFIRSDTYFQGVVPVAITAIIFSGLFAINISQPSNSGSPLEL